MGRKGKRKGGEVGRKGKREEVRWEGREVRWEGEIGMRVHEALIPTP